MQNGKLKVYWGPEKCKFWSSKLLWKISNHCQNIGLEQVFARWPQVLDNAKCFEFWLQDSMFSFGPKMHFCNFAQMHFCNRVKSRSSEIDLDGDVTVRMDNFSVRQRRSNQIEFERSRPRWRCYCTDGQFFNASMEVQSNEGSVKSTWMEM